jgi:hypothetical protein
MTQRYKLPLDELQLTSIRKVIAFQAAEEYCSCDVTKVQYSVSRLCSDEKDKVTVRINHKSNSLRENVIYLLVKMKLCVYKHPNIPEAVRACD